jgi:hypothetical protein
MAKSYNHQNHLRKEIEDREYSDGTLPITASKKNKTPKKIRNCYPEEAISIFSVDEELFEKIHSNR